MAPLSVRRKIELRNRKLIRVRILIYKQHCNKNSEQTKMPLKLSKKRRNQIN